MTYGYISAQPLRRTSAGELQLMLSWKEAARRLQRSPGHPKRSDQRVFRDLRLASLATSVGTTEEVGSKHAALAHPGRGCAPCGAVQK